jgi:hypothetical protein
VPALSAPDIDATALAWTRAGVLPAGKEHVVPVGVPTARPTTTSRFNVPSGRVSAADVKVTVTIPPPCPTVKLPDTLWRTPLTAAGTVPLSVELLVVGDTVGDVLELLSQAAVARTIASATRAKCFKPGPLPLWGHDDDRECHWARRRRRVFIGHLDTVRSWVERGGKWRGTRRQ